MAISQRQQNLLSALIREYVRLAKPVSSGALVTEENLELSPATVRNDLMALEDAGYLSQPHTSAGRVPTEKAWLWFVGTELASREVSKHDRDQLDGIVHVYRHVHDQLMRRLAKSMAELIKETVIVASTPSSTFSTGLSHLFAQPEFEVGELAVTVSKVIDHLDDVMEGMFDQIDDDVRVLVGRQNPFGVECGAIVARYHLPHHGHGLIGILGPVRQDYEEHVAMVKYAQDLLNDQVDE